MNCHIRSHSFSGRLGSSLGTAWRNLILKVTSSERLAKSPRRKVLETVAGKLLCLFGLIAVATAFALLIITNLAVAVIRSWWGASNLWRVEKNQPQTIWARISILAITIVTVIT